MYVGTGEQFTPSFLLGVYSNGYAYKFPVAGIQSWLGLGSLAYSSATIPTNNNQLTNGAGYITSSGSISGSAGSVAWTNVTGRPTALSSFTNDLGNYGSWITSSASISGNAGSVTYLMNRTDSAAYPVLWGANYTNTIGTIAYSCAAVTIQSSTGTLSATTFSGALSGNATTASSISGYNNPTTAATANTIVYRDGSGDIYGRYLFGSYQNSSDNVDTGTITYIMAKFGDNYHRSATAAKVQSFLGLGSNAYTSTTIPTNNNQLTNGAGYITGVSWSGVTSKPSYIMYYQGFTLDANTMDNNATGFTYAVNAPHTGPIVRFSEPGYPLQLNAAYTGGQGFSFRTRNGDAGTWNSWYQIIHAGNIGSQTVNRADGSLKLWATSHPNDYYIVNNWTGSYWQLTTNHGAGVQVSYANNAGNANNADTVGGLSIHGGRNNEVNKIVRTDANGYIQAGWINSNSGNMGYENRIARIQCSDDQYIRYQTLTEFKVSLGLSGRNNYSRRIDYSSDANYHVGSFGHNGISTNDVWHYGSGFYDVWSGGGSFPGSMTHIHGFNAVHYSAGAGGNGYGWQMASQYDRPGEYWARNISGGSFSSWRQFITSDNIGSQSVSYASSAGSANSVAWTNVSSRPTAVSSFTNDSGYITSGSNVVGLYSSGFGNGNFTWYQSPGGLQQYGGSWASFLISNHGAGVDYYNQTIIMPFWGAPQYMRKEGNVNRGPWTFWTEENLNPITTSNIGSQSVSYATTSGTAARATRSNGQFYIDDDHGCSVIGVYSSYRFQGVYSMGSAYVLPTNGTTPGNLYGMAWSHPNAGGQATRLNDHGLLVMINGVTQAAISSNIWAAGDVTAYSDARVKENIEVINNAVKKIQAIRGVTFTRNDMTDTTTRHAGVIAQEVLEVLPEVITKDANDHYSVAYGNLNALLIEAIKEQQLQIEELKNKLDNVLSSR
jgi:hypothetical protein